MTLIQFCRLKTELFQRTDVTVSVMTEGPVFISCSEAIFCHYCFNTPLQIRCLILNSIRLQEVLLRDCVSGLFEGILQGYISMFMDDALV